MMGWQPQDELAQSVALEVLLHGPLGRSELARRLSLAPATLTRISTDLIASGLLTEVRSTRTGASGRPSIPLAVVPDSHHFLGIKVADDCLTAAVINLKAQVLSYDQLPLTMHSPKDVVEGISSLASQAEKTFRIDAIGVGIGGVVTDQGIIRSAPFLEWEDVDLVGLLREHIKIPVFVANDLTAYTQAQHWFDLGAQHRNFAVLTLGIGTGYGCVANGRPLENQDSGIGLVGHWPLDPLGPLCSQGHRGCAESMLTTPAITRSISEALGREVSWSDVISLAEAEDPAVSAVLRASGLALGRLIGAIANLTAPEVVIIGGEGVALASLSNRWMRQGLAETRDPRASLVRIELASPANETWCRGAAVIGLQGYVSKRRS